jgi:hypothetical protein
MCCLDKIICSCVICLLTVIFAVLLLSTYFECIDLYKHGLDCPNYWEKFGNKFDWND